MGTVDAHLRAQHAAPSPRQRADGGPMGTVDAHLRAQHAALSPRERADGRAHGRVGVRLTHRGPGRHDEHPMTHVLRGPRP